MNEHDNILPVSEEPATEIAPAIPEASLDQVQPQPAIAQEAPVIPEKIKTKKKFAGGILIAILLILVLGAGTASALIAYNIVPFENIPLKNKISSLVMSLPFAPKTPEYLINASLEAHKKVSTGYVDVSVASSGDSLNSYAGLLGSSSSDIGIKGSFDLSDPKNPISEMTLMLGTELEVDTVVKNKKIYANIKEIPLSIQAMLGMYLGLTSEEYTNKWFYYEVEEFSSGAKSALEEEGLEDKNLQAKLYDELYKRVFTEKVLKNTKVSSEELDGADVYKLEFSADSKLIKEILQETSEIQNEEMGANSYTTNPILKDDTIKNIKINAYLLKNTKIMKKLDIVVSSEMPSYSPGVIDMNSTANASKSEMNFAITIMMDKVGEPINVEEPTGATKFKDFIDEATKKYQEALMVRYQTQLQEEVMEEGNFEIDMSSEDISLENFMQEEEPLEEETPVETSSNEDPNSAFGSLVR